MLPAIKNGKPKIKNRKCPGFTLVELIVTIGIMVFVLSITVVAFTPVFRAAGIKSAGRTLRAALDGARIRAVQQRRQVRFEAQRIPDTLKDQWRVTSGAGELSQEWKVLPEFISVQTNLAAGDRGDDGRGGTYGDGIERISITFGPDGSVVRYALGTDSKGALDPPGETNAPFALRFESTRDAYQGESQRRRAWLVVIPLTGGIEQSVQEG